jgi:hypothetical protein
MAWERAKEWLGIGKALVHDPRIPRPVRWALMIGLLPIPGPFDEAIALIAVGLIALFWRPAFKQIRAEQRSARTTHSI